VVTAICFALMVARFMTEIPPGNRIWFIAAVVVIFFVFFFLKRKTLRKRDQPVQMEISEREMAFIGSNSRSAMPWTAFSQCLESPGLFVLLDKPKRLLFAIPKRAFPDEKSQDWFRTLTKELENPRTTEPAEALMPGRIAGNGIALTIQLKFRDFLVRMFTSWRSKGFGLGFGALCMGMCLFTPKPEHAVFSRGQMMLITVATLVPILTVAFFGATFIAWRSEKKFMGPQHLVIGSHGVQFADRSGSGLLAWSTYKYYMENRWAFFIWNPQGSLWIMLPKRDFASAMDVEQVRNLLRTNLKASRWFYF
jgi:YcxB-like protein